MLVTGRCENTGSDILVYMKHTPMVVVDLTALDFEHNVDINF